MRAGIIPDDQRCVHRLNKNMCVECLNWTVHEQWERAEKHEQTISSMIVELDQLRDSLANWATMLLARDEVQGREVLKRMVEYYQKHDSKADDFGRLYIVTDALRALGQDE